jgi:hypothetical protein
VHAARRTRQSGVALAELPADEPHPVAIGDLVGGKYRVTRILGVGGMGVVAAAEHEDLGQHVALKIMRAARKTPETVERFLAEARAAVRLKSSHVAKVRDVGTLPSGLPYMVMDLLEGSDLYTVLQDRGALSVEEAVDYILQACDAIADAHSLGIVHRDIKPENLFVTTRRDGSPHVRVLDFGVSKMGGLEGQTDGATKRSVTHETAIIGSPSYMSPEQIRSAKTVDLRTDIWALGCTLYELLTGQEAFGADNAPDIFVKVLEKAAPPLHELRPDLPDGLEEVVGKCLEKDREKRYENIDAFASALMRFSSTRATSMPPSWRDYIQVDIDYDALKPALVPGALPQGGKPAAETFVLPGRPKARRKKYVVLLALVLLGAGAGAAWVKREPLRAAYARARGVGAAATAAEPTATAPEPAVSLAVTAPAPEPAASASAAAPEPEAEASAAASAPEPEPSASAKGGAKPKGTRPAATGKRPVSRPASHPASHPAATVAPSEPAPEPTHHRTDW